MLIKRNIYFQDLREDIREEILSEVTQIFQQNGLDGEFAQEEANSYINTHNFCNEFAL
jgi:hypothetical protein